MAARVWLRVGYFGSTRAQFLVLAPTDRASEKAIDEYGVGTVLKATLTQPRNVKHHRKYWALLGVIFDYQQTYNDLDELHAAVKCALGYGRTVKVSTETKGGTRIERVTMIPGSIAFSKMDQKKFETFYERFVELVFTRIIPNLDDDDRARLEARFNEIMEGEKDDA